MWITFQTVRPMASLPATKPTASWTIFALWISARPCGVRAAGFANLTRNLKKRKIIVTTCARADGHHPSLFHLCCCEYYNFTAELKISTENEIFVKKLENRGCS